MDRFKEEAVYVLRVPVDYILSQCRVRLKHCLKLWDGKLQYLHIGERNRTQRKLNAEIGRVITGENGSRSVKAYDLAVSAFMIGEMDGRAGYIVLDAVIGLPRFPEIVSLLKYPFGMGLRKKILVKCAEVIRKIISRNQHIDHLALRII